MSKISIIVPIYNTEKYLHSCIDSILTQTYTDFELILVNDGSTDRSGTICDEYAVKDPRIRVFHKENGGVTSARKLGVEEARSEWISFVDSDDELYLNSMSLLYSHIKDDIDIIIANNNNKFEVISSDEFVRKTLCAEIYSSLWGRLYRKSAVIHQMDSIPERLTIGEDTILNIKIGCNSCRKILIINKDSYKYRENPNSVMNTRVVNLEYEEFFIQEVRKALGERFSDFKNEFYSVCLGVLELLVVCRVPVSYTRPWIVELIKTSKNWKLPFRKWAIINIKHNVICRYILAIERRIKIIMNRYD